MKAMLLIPEKNSYIVFQRFKQNTCFAAIYHSLRITSAKWLLSKIISLWSIGSSREKKRSKKEKKLVTQLQEWLPSTKMWMMMRTKSKVRTPLPMRWANESWTWNDFVKNGKIKSINTLRAHHPQSTTTSHSPLSSALFSPASPAALRDDHPLPSPVLLSCREEASSASARTLLSRDSTSWFTLPWDQIGTTDTAITSP